MNWKGKIVSEILSVGAAKNGKCQSKEKKQNKIQNLNGNCLSMEHNWLSFKTLTRRLG